jgi:hypothetical protein
VRTLDYYEIAGYEDEDSRTREDRVESFGDRLGLHGHVRILR